MLSIEHMSLHNSNKILDKLRYNGSLHSVPWIIQTRMLKIIFLKAFCVFFPSVSQRHVQKNRLVLTSLLKSTKKYCEPWNFKGETLWDKLAN